MADASGEGRKERRREVERYDVAAVIGDYVLDSMDCFRCCSLMELCGNTCAASQRALTRMTLSAGVTRT
jgi:hypothetical protein